jgi:zinc transport system substrate-binding protein
VAAIGAGLAALTGRELRWLTRGMALLLAMLPAVAAAEAAAPPLRAFVSILPEKYFVERIGGPNVEVAVLVGPGRSPETYEPTPRQLSELSRSRLYFNIGVDFEDVWLKRIAATNPRLRMVDLRRGLPLRRMDPTPGETAAPGGMQDPHVWTSPLLVKTMAVTIRDALADADPAHRQEYAANCAAFVADLDRLDRDIRAILRPVQRRRFMVFHPAWGYFADAYGLRQIPIEVAGKEPGARALAKIIDLGRRDGVKVIFVQSQFSRRSAQTMAAALGARVVAVDPLAEDYIDNLRAVARKFAEDIR